jgi:2-polyprenyl-6-methoxyphenol hydroxylase-like FAD-dependent oxidoreductase
MSNPSSHPKICIIGAGIAGLTLARVLVNNSLHPVVLERDTSPSARAQGGSLDLKRESGQLALKIANLHSEFQKLMRLEGQDIKVMLPNGTILMQHIVKDETDYNPEIDRTQLRGIFLEKLGDHVKWGSFVKAVEPVAASDGSGYAVTLEDGSFQVYDIVIGADGCFSRLRSLLTDIRPEYAGATFTETYISDAPTKHPEEHALVGRGMMVVPAAAGNGKGIIAQQNTDGKLRVHAVFKVPEDWTKTNGYPWEKDFAATRKMLLENYLTEGGWIEGLQDLFRKSDDTFRPWPIYALPVGHKWEHKPGLSLIGDAAHVMSPFAGEGANIAMLDGAKLGEAIAGAVTNGLDIYAAIRDFEEDMFTRAEKSASESHKNMQEFLGAIMDPNEFAKSAQDWEEEMRKRDEPAK